MFCSQPVIHKSKLSDFLRPYSEEISYMISNTEETLHIFLMFVTAIKHLRRCLCLYNHLLLFIANNNHITFGVLFTFNTFRTSHWNVCIITCISLLYKLYWIELERNARIITSSNIVRQRSSIEYFGNILKIPIWLE